MSEKKPHRSISWPVLLIAGAKKVPATVHISSGLPRHIEVTPFQLHIEPAELDYLMRKLNG